MNLLIVGDSHAKGRLPHGGADSDAIAIRVATPPEFRLAVSGSTALQWASDQAGWFSQAQAMATRSEAALISLLGNDYTADRSNNFSVVGNCSGCPGCLLGLA